MEKIRKMIKEEEEKFEHEIENEFDECEKQIDDICETDIHLIKDEVEEFETEIHKKGLEITKKVTETEEKHDKKNSYNKSK